MSNAVLEKIEIIRNSGAEAYKAGTVKVFTGFPENLKRRFNVALAGRLKQWDPTHDSFEREVVSLDSEFRLKGYFVVMDYPLHSTILEAIWEGSEEGMGTVFATIHNETTSLVRRTNVKEVAYDTLVLDANGALLIMKKEIPDQIIELREKLGEIYHRNGLKVLPLDDMLHATLHRARVLTPDSKKEYFSMGQYFKRVENYNSELGPQGAFNLTVEGFYVGPVWNLLHAGVGRREEVSIVR